MSIKPILFSGPMVRAILEGRKTQTRRVIKPQPPTEDEWLEACPDRIIPYNMEVEQDKTGQWWWNNEDLLGRLSVPHAIGDLLYVREAWRTLKAFDADPPRNIGKGNLLSYVADKVGPLFRGEGFKGRFRQGMHMPRWASRITLEVTNVRVERLQDISEVDADAECFGGDFPYKIFPELFHPERSGDLSIPECFGVLWDSINSTRNDGEYSWENNPWVAAYTFKPIFQNVDTIGGE